MCGKTTSSLNGTHTAFVRERRYCCENVHSVVLSLDDKKGEFYWKTTVTIARPFKILMEQRTTRTAKNQWIAGANSFVLENFYFHGFSEMDQEYPYPQKLEKLCCNSHRLLVDDQGCSRYFGKD